MRRKKEETEKEDTKGKREVREEEGEKGTTGRCWPSPQLAVKSLTKHTVSSEEFD